MLTIVSTRGSLQTAWYLHHSFNSPQETQHSSSDLSQKLTDEKNDTLKTKQFVKKTFGKNSELSVKGWVWRHSWRNTNEEWTIRPFFCYRSMFILRLPCIYEFVGNQANHWKSSIPGTKKYFELFSSNIISRNFGPREGLDIHLFILIRLKEAIKT